MANTNTGNTKAEIKLIALQVPWDRQGSPFDGDWLGDDVIIAGNKKMNGHNEDDLETLKKQLDSASMEYSEFENRESDYYKTVRELVEDLFYNAEELDDDSINRIEDVLRKWGDIDEDWRDVVTEALSALTGKEYGYRTIIGSSQSDWNYIFYPESMKSAVRGIEIEYFNTGTEFWVMQMGSGELDDYIDDDGNFIVSLFDKDERHYCYTYNYKNEIAEFYGIAPENVMIVEFDDYVKVPRYKIAT